LLATLISNIRLDPEIDDGEVLDRVIVWFEAPDHGKAFAMMDLLAQTVKLVSEPAQREVGRAHKISIQF
jgi:hypothetical protein